MGPYFADVIKGLEVRASWSNQGGPKSMTGVPTRDMQRKKMEGRRRQRQEGRGHSPAAPRGPQELGEADRGLPQRPWGSTALPHLDFSPLPPKQRPYISVVSSHLAWVMQPQARPPAPPMGRLTPPRPPPEDPGVAATGAQEREALRLIS